MKLQEPKTIQQMGGSWNEASWFLFTQWNWIRHIAIVVVSTKTVLFDKIELYYAKAHTDIAAKSIELLKSSWYFVWVPVWPATHGPRQSLPTTTLLKVAKICTQKKLYKYILISGEQPIPKSCESDLESQEK